MSMTENNHSLSSRKNLSKTLAGLHNYQGLQNFSNLCRTCANNADQVCPIFDDQSQQDDLASKINKYLPIKVSKEDGLPQVICYQCHSTILAWDQLVKCSIQAKIVLQQKLPVSQFGDPVSTAKQKETADSIKINTQTDHRLSYVKSLNGNDGVDDSIIVRVGRVYDQRDPDKPLDIVTKDGKKYGVCNVCKKNISIASWKRHSRSHHAVKRYSCHTCGLGFNDSGNLSRHRRALHATHRPHGCHICDKAFSRNGHLQDHIKSHSENRDYVCDTCGKASKSSAALRMHRKIHEDEYRFGCVYCEAKFKRSGQLRAHVSVHTGEKAHECACGKAFRLKSQLTTHARTHARLNELPQS